MGGRLLIYGATGFTGRLIAAEARRRRMDVALAGRSARRLKPLAESLGLPWVAAGLDDAAKLTRVFRTAEAVLNVAGPFAETAEPVVEACLRAGAHYLDVTGELPVFRALHRYDAEARARGLMIMPGVGFAIVASDCLAAYVAGALPEAQYLRIGLSHTDAVSRGSLRTMVALVSETVVIRQDGLLVRVPVGRLERRFDYGDGPRISTALSWADAFTAHYTTAIPNIEVYAEASLWGRSLYQVCAWFAGPMRLAPWQRMIEVHAKFWPEGPTAAKRAATPRVLVAEVEDRWRRKLSARLHTPDGYSLTPSAALAVAERVLAGDLLEGFRTPAGVYGADFILGFAGIQRERVARSDWP